MAFDYEYKNSPLLSKVKIGDQVYYLKDAEARAALEAEIAKLGTAAYRAAADVVVEDSDDLVSGKAVAAYLEGTLADVTKALIFQGVSTTNPAEETPIIDGVELVASKGDVVLYGTKEFVYDGSKWVELGDEGVYLTKAAAAELYVAKTFTIAGIDMADNITAEELKTALGLKALAFKDSASGSVTTADSVADAKYTPAGSVDVTLTTAPTAMASTGNFKPAGTVSGTTTAAGTVSIAKSDDGVQISGTVSAPSITVTPSTVSVQHIDSVGTLASYTAAQYVAPSVTEAKDQFAKDGVVAAIDENDAEMLVFTNATKSDALTGTGFNAGSYTEAVYTPATLPTLGEAKNVLTGVQATASAPVFTGDKFGASFAGSATEINATFAGTEAAVNVTGNYDKATAATGSFTGTEATISHELNKTAKTITVQ